MPCQLRKSNAGRSMSHPRFLPGACFAQRIAGKGCGSTHAAALAGFRKRSADSANGKCELCWMYWAAWKHQQLPSVPRFCKPHQPSRPARVRLPERQRHGDGASIGGVLSRHEARHRRQVLRRGRQHVRQAIIPGLSCAQISGTIRRTMGSRSTGVVYLVVFQSS